MTTAAVSTIHFAKVPEHIIHEGLPPSALLVLSHLMLYMGKSAEVFVCQEKTSEVCHMSTRTLRRIISFLIKAGRLKENARRHLGRHKTYSLFLEKFDSPEEKRSLTPETVKPIKIEEPKPPVKEEPKEEPQKERDEGELEKQKKHLAHLQQNGAEINNPDGWLKAAVKNNYALPKELVAKEEQTKKQDLQKMALKLVSEAQDLYKIKRYKKSLQLIHESQAIIDTVEAFELQGKIREVEKTRRHFRLAKHRMNKMERLRIFNDGIALISTRFGLSRAYIFGSKLYRMALAQIYVQALIKQNADYIAFKEAGTKGSAQARH